VLDAGPLGRLANPLTSAENARCNQWLRDLLASGASVVIPEIADYEVRRELLRANLVASIAQLDALKQVLFYAPLTTPAILKAAEFWAAVRNQGKTTAPDHALDGDVILAAQTVLLAQPGDEVMIATTNTKHLTLFVDARIWQDIAP